MEKEESNPFPSQLRYDLVSKDWVIIATGRAKKPQLFKQARKPRRAVRTKDCPFCKIETQLLPTLVFSNGKRQDLKKNNGKIPKNWTTVAIPNKYPALLPHPDLGKKIEGGLYQTMNAVGFHEVVVTRNHQKTMAKFSLKEAKELMDVYQARYLDLMKKKFVNYISIFHNHGQAAGASIEHPHSQIITTPLIDSDLNKALINGHRYFKKFKECIYCRMNRWEMGAKKRIIFENKNFIAVCPFASKAAFQVIISPKKHLSYFERITEKEKIDLADAFRTACAKLEKGLNSPAYNFYLHTAPCDRKKYPFYHWHWTIIPKTSTWAGFEIGTRIEISTIEPEKAAQYLREQRT